MTALITSGRSEKDSWEERSQREERGMTMKRRSKEETVTFPRLFLRIGSVSSLGALADRQAPVSLHAFFPSTFIRVGLTPTSSRGYVLQEACLLYYRLDVLHRMHDVCQFISLGWFLCSAAITARLLTRMADNRRG